MRATDRYDEIGVAYAHARRADPRVERMLDQALGDAATVVNVGAGAGSYEPADRAVVAVDPSETMLAQRPSTLGPAVRGVAEALPFPADAFDAALVVLSVHHWRDLRRGLSELRRVARRQVVLFFEPAVSWGFWLIEEYFPDSLQLETERRAPGTAALAAHLDVVSIEAVPVPADCTDGFAGCYWNRPEAYLDPVVQGGISSLALLDDEARRRGTERLRADLESGAWDRRHGALRARGEIDLGYRILVAGR